MAKGTVNEVTILGRLGKDPESRATSQGTTVVTLSVATNELGKKDPNTGQYVGETEWHRCILFGKTADAAVNYLKQGSNVFLKGRIKTEKYQDKTSGQDRYSMSIICEKMEFIGGDGKQSNQSNAPAPNKPQQGFNQQNNQGQQQQNNQPQQGFNQQPKQNNQPNNGFDSFEDDQIPF